MDKIIRPTVTILISFMAVAFVAIGCAGMSEKECGTGPKAALLKRLLNATDNQRFNSALLNHGPLTADELPCIAVVIKSSKSTRRRNAAKLLPLVRGDASEIKKIKEETALETGDLFVWAKMMDSLMGWTAKSDASDVASKRHDMIGKALDDDESFIQSVGLKAGVQGKYPGIEKELAKRLESDQPKVLEVALNSLSPENARSELSRLLKMLDNYESGTGYSGVNFELYFFVPLLHALIRTEDPAGYLAVRNALEKDYKNANLVRGTRKEFSKFRNTAAVLRPDIWMKKFCLYLIKEDSVAAPAAINILMIQITRGHQEPSEDVVKVCVDEIKTGNLDNTDWRKHRDDKSEQRDCETLFKFLDTGSSKGKRILGSDAVEFGEKWLEENNKSS